MLKSILEYLYIHLLPSNFANKLIEPVFIQINLEKCIDYLLILFEIRFQRAHAFYYFVEHFTGLLLD